MKKGEVISVRKRSLLFVKWKDKREVSLLINIHDAFTIVNKRMSKSGVGGYEETETNCHRGVQQVYIRSR